MKVIDSNRTYIDYFQSDAATTLKGLTHRFGIRVQENLILAIVQSGDGHDSIISKEYQMPVQFETLPSYVRMVLDDHVHNNPSSDLLDLLTGRKSFQEALESPQKTELKRMTATRR